MSAPTATRRRAAGERGSGTVLVLGVIGVLLALAVGVAALIQAQAAAGRARLAADLAALGGATALNSITAPDDPCAVAGNMTRANEAALGWQNIRRIKTEPIRKLCAVSCVRFFGELFPSPAALRYAEQKVDERAERKGAH